MSNIAKYPEPNCQRLLSEFLRLIQIDSTSYREAAIASQLSADLQSIGCTVVDDQSTAITGSDSGNLIATLPATPGQAGKLYFSAHMDSVEPGQGIKYQIEDGVISSQGQTILAGDDKVGIAAALEMLRTLVESGLPHPEIVILLSVAEEDGLIGARAMDGEALGFAG
ncbi:MAG: M20/M25/M40 family metallo-hydrolase, partial [Coriobacteriales bacterium]|nr:M20/M25/M40 family metallo-hydrolase [Coriobacteriales bacterium]